MANETVASESVQTAYTAAQQELADLENATAVVCQELEEGSVQSGISTISRMWALSSQMTSRMKRTLFLGVQKTLRVVSTHYQLNLEEVSSNGYVVDEHLINDEVLVAIEEADATMEGATKALSSLFEGELFPGDDEDAAGANGAE